MAVDDLLVVLGDQAIDSGEAAARQVVVPR
jgi:hypothetical protein